MRAPGSLRAPAGGRRGLVLASPGAVALGWPPGGLLGFRSWLGPRGVLFIISLTARPTRGRAPRAPRLYWGAGAAARALFACGTTAGRQAAILSPRLLSLGGGGESLAPSPRRAWTWRQLGEVAPGPSDVLWDPMGVPSRRHGPEALLERRNRRCTGRATILRAGPPNPQGAPSPPFSTAPFLLKPFRRS